MVVVAIVVVVVGGSTPRVVVPAVVGRVVDGEVVATAEAWVVESAAVGAGALVVVFGEVVPAAGDVPLAEAAAPVLAADVPGATSEGSMGPAFDPHAATMATSSPRAAICCFFTRFTPGSGNCRAGAEHSRRHG